MFTKDYARQGVFIQVIRRWKDEEELSKLSNNLKEAFEQFQVCLFLHISPLSFN
jgi:hypothetical protein